jgi:hypothetical protein
MDISKLKQRLATLQNPKGQKKEVSQDLWRPSVGKHQVRIVPSAYTKENPFRELYIHYGINNKMMLSPTSYGEKDPIVEFAQQLRKTNDWQSAKKLEPKMRVFAPVIVRGEEEKGVRLWEFGKQTYMEILKLIEEIGDFTDPVEGHDLIVEVLDKATTGLMYNTSKVRISVKTSQLSSDAQRVQTWLETQPDPLSIFKRWNYDEMKSALESHLNPEEELKEQADFVEEKSEEEKPKQYTLNTAKKSTPASDSFDDLFELPF